MWPFKKKSKVEELSPRELNFSQLDLTEGFDDHRRLSNDEWIDTIPLNAILQPDQLGNVPPIGAADDEIYRIAEDLSKVRESFDGYDDGVYCPICHIASTDSTRLRTPCDRCGRPLLSFGWT